MPIRAYFFWFRLKCQQSERDETFSNKNMYILKIKAHWQPFLSHVYVKVGVSDTIDAEYRPKILDLHITRVFSHVQFVYFRNILYLLAHCDWFV